MSREKGLFADWIYRSRVLEMVLLEIEIWKFISAKVEEPRREIKIVRIITEVEGVSSEKESQRSLKKRDPRYMGKMWVLQV